MHAQTDRQTDRERERERTQNSECFIVGHLTHYRQQQQHKKRTEKKKINKYMPREREREGGTAP